MSCYTPNFTYLCAIRQIWKTEQARHPISSIFPVFSDRTDYHIPTTDLRFQPATPFVCNGSFD